MTTSRPGYDFWLFDLDGTLVDVEWPYIREVFDRVGDRLGRSFTDREAEIIWYGLGSARSAQLREWGIDPDAFWTVFDAVDDPRTRAAATYLYEDAEWIRTLECPTGVVTHCPPAITQQVLDRLDIRDWFGTVVCCSDDLGWKPDPRPVEVTVEQLGVAGRSDGVLVGDGANDIGAAWNAGLDGIHVERHNPHRRRQCVLGDRRIEGFEELQSMLSD
ncbi:MAG: HAD family hydrolase [Halobacteriales archaeon]